MQYKIFSGDCLEVLAGLPDNSINCCVTSPPYFGLRDYGQDGQIGLEPTPDEYVAKLVAVFRQVRRVLREDGTCWLNLGDSYATSDGLKRQQPHRDNSGGLVNNRINTRGSQSWTAGSVTAVQKRFDCKPKNLIGIPWRVAFALQADGWYLRQDIIWHKPNPMPESVTDRCTKAHEYIFLLTKSARYFYDHEAVKEHGAGRLDFGKMSRVGVRIGETKETWTRDGTFRDEPGRNRRSVWTVATKPYSGAHFAVFPQELIRPCIKAGCPEGGTVLDPFNGAGTSGVVAIQENRRYIGIELNPEYIALAEERIQAEVLPLFDDTQSC